MDDAHCSLVGQDGRGTHYGSLSEEAIKIPQEGGCSLSPSQSSCLGNRCSHRPVCLTYFQPSDAALDQKSTAKVFSNGCTRIGEGERLYFEVGSSPSW